MYGDPERPSGELQSAGQATCRSHLSLGVSSRPHATFDLPTFDIPVNIRHGCMLSPHTLDWISLTSAARKTYPLRLRCSPDLGRPRRHQAQYRSNVSDISMAPAHALLSMLLPLRIHIESARLTNTLAQQVSRPHRYQRRPKRPTQIQRPSRPYKFG